MRPYCLSVRRACHPFPVKKPPYSDEIEALPSVYVGALAAKNRELELAVGALGSGPTVFAGSGGTMVLSSLASRLHENRYKQPGRACTALELVDLPQFESRGAMLFTASGKHPDAQRVMKDFFRRRFEPTVVLTHREPADLRPKAGVDTTIVQAPPLPHSDGFLATGSIMQMTVLLLRAYSQGDFLSSSLAIPEVNGELRSKVLVLTSPAFSAVASDIEVRLVESGIASVQVADFRNFAHGRHTGFSREMENTTVIALSDSNSEQLAVGTLQTLPSEADIRHWHHGGSWPDAFISLLARSMVLAGAAGLRNGFDVARPKVPEFGRRLYRLPLGSRVPEHLTSGVDRKLMALGAGGDPNLTEMYREAFRTWRDSVRDHRFDAVVMDYDGTVCATSRRWELPSEEVRDSIVRLLEAGATIGFASGRGKSIHRDSRKWIPRRFWDQVQLGLYNGAITLALTEDLPEIAASSDWSREVSSVVSRLPFSDRLEVEERCVQVSVGVKGGIERHRLAALVRSALIDEGVPSQVVSSGHSVDVILPDTTKTSVLDLTGRTWGEGVLAIGDQGQIDGNDYALLASGEFTLSVDRCSPDPTRCWFLGDGRLVGPDLLVRYLRDLRPLKEGLALTIKGD